MNSIYSIWYLIDNYYIMETFLYQPRPLTAGANLFQ